MIKTLLDFAEYVPYNVKLAHALGGAERAIILAVLINRHNYYESREELDDGFFYSTADTMEEKSAIGGRAQDSAIKHLIESGLVIKKLKGIPARSHYKFPDDFDEKLTNILKNWKELQNKFLQIAETRGRKMQRQKPANCGTNDNRNNNNNKEEEKKEETPTPFSDGKNKPKNKCDAQPIPVGLDAPDFVAAWSQLLDTKKWRSKEPSAINLALKKLSVYDVAFAIQLVETATMGGYQGVVFPDTPNAYEKWQKTKQTNTHVFQEPHPNFANKPLYVNHFADRWAKVKRWRMNFAELENGQHKDYSHVEIAKMLAHTEPLKV